MKKLSNINQILLFLIIVIVLIYFGAIFLIPFVFGIFFAIVMSPFSTFMEKIWNNRIFSSLLGTLVIFLVVGGVLFAFVHQISLFTSDIPSIRDKLESLLQGMQSRITSVTNLSLEDQKDIWQKRSENITNTVESGLADLSGKILNATASFFLVLVYVFLFLYYRTKLHESMQMYVERQNKKEVKEVLLNIRQVIFQYLWGRAKVMSILGVMYYITFLIFGMPYALLLAIFGALVTIIPYIGPLISGVIPIIFAFIFLDSVSIAFLFAIIVLVIQLVESYVLEPLIIGNQVKINPLIVIIAVLIGGAFWGIAGMILFVPIFAMFKIIFNHTSGLRPLGYLFGNSETNNKDK